MTKQRRCIGHARHVTTIKWSYAFKREKEVKEWDANGGQR